MHFVRSIACAALLASVASPTLAQDQPTGTLRAGVARVDITPTDLANLNPFGGGAFTAVHDPIYARALVLGDGRETVAVVSFDLPEVGDMTAFRRRIERETGIRYDHIMLAATHDHSAPRLGGISPGTRAQRPSAESDRYSASTFDKVLGAIKAAKASAAPARFAMARGAADVNVSRDAYTPGRGWGMGYNPDGPSDKTVRVLRFDTAAGKPLAILFAYGVHSVVTFGIKEVSGDLAGATERVIEENGDGVTALFIMGAGGDQVPRVQRLRSGPAGPPTAADRNFAFRAMDAQALVLGAEVLRVSNGMRDLTGDVRVRAAARTLPCPVKPTGPAEMSTLVADPSPTVRIQLSAITLNQVAIGGIGGDVVTPIQTRLLRETPLTDTIMATLVNDRIGYIANDAAYDTPLFEVNGSPAARGCAEGGIVDGLTAMFREQSR